MIEINSKRWLSIEPLDGEIWKDVDGYGGFYEVSNIGRVRSKERITEIQPYCHIVRKPRILKGEITNIGRRVMLKFNGQQHKVLVCKLVATAFIQNPNKFSYVRHLDNNNLNDTMCNLQWCACKPNCIHDISKGKRYGSLTVIKYEGEKHYKCGRKDKLWRCVCDCGKEIVTTQYSLVRGTSCGCEQRRLQALASTTHGGHNTKLYGVWCTMKNRCNNPNVTCYNHYGGRGITVCSEWLDFSKFMEWAFKNGYKEGLTIERVDVNGNYEPSNCKWIPSALQAKNKTNNRKLTYRGKVYILQDLANATGVDRRLISARVKRGWSVERAVEFPARKGYNGMNPSILNDNGTTD